MVIELINLLNIVKSLVNAKSTLDKNYFQQFIEPTWDAFSTIHQTYLKSFQEYRQLIDDEDADAEKLYEQIRQDIMYSLHLTNELKQLINHIPVHFLKTKQTYVADFAKALMGYFDYRNSVSSTLNVLSQYGPLNQLSRHEFYYFLNVRYALVRDLGRLASDWDETDIRTKTRNVIDQFALAQQSKYEQVANSYYQLRNKMLM